MTNAEPGKIKQMSRCVNCGEVVEKGPREWWHSDTGLAECDR